MSEVTGTDVVSQVLRIEDSWLKAPRIQEKACVAFFGQPSATLCGRLPGDGEIVAMIGSIEDPTASAIDVPIRTDIESSLQVAFLIRRVPTCAECLDAKEIICALQRSVSTRFFRGCEFDRRIPVRAVLQILQSIEGNDGEK